MGDESRFRYRRDENSASDGRAPRVEHPGAPTPRTAPGGSRADDALAELARLIGDQDPFADFGDLHKPEPEPVRARPRAEAAPIPQFAAAPVERRFDDWQPGRRGLREPPPGTPSPQAPTPPADEWTEQGRGAVRSGYGSLSRKPERDPEPEPEYYDDEPDVPTRAGVAPPHGQAQPQGRHVPPGEDDAAYAYSAQRDQYQDDYDDAYDPAYTDDGYMPPHDEDLYGAEPRRRKSRMILLLVASVIGLVVAGVAGVFAYRMATGSDTTQSAAGQPPVIKAGSTPVKTAGPTPGAPGADGQKLIYDRVGGAQPGTERVVPREEQPVDVNAAAAAAAAAQPASQSAPGATEPKKVKTLTVRADGSVVTPTAVPAAQPARPSGVAPVAYAPNQNPVPVTPPAPSPVATTPATGATAAVTPPPTAPAANGAYVVQVSSQKSESDALGSWKVLQSRFPQLLGSYKATVKKADLGDRGIYYRAQVGPFSTREQANDLCNSLRAQGGDCLVQKN